MDGYYLPKGFVPKAEGAGMKTVEEVADMIGIKASHTDQRLLNDPFFKTFIENIVNRYADEKLEEAAKIAEEVPHRTGYLGVDSVIARIDQGRITAEEIRALKSTPAL